MKKLKLVSIILVAVALFILQSCSGSGTKTSTAEQKVEGATITPTEGSIVFVRMDSLLNAYDMYHDLKSELEEEVKKVQTELETKGRALQRDFADLEEKVSKGLITRSQGQEKATEIQNRDQQLRQQSEKARMDLDDKQMVMLNQINEAVNTFISKYNESKGYSLIISTSGGTPVLWGNKGLDITADVLKGLNEEYIKTKAK